MTEPDFESTIVMQETPTTPRRRWGLRLLSLLLLVVVACAAWAWITLTWDYSDGDRAGVLQKFSR